MRLVGRYPIVKWHSIRELKVVETALCYIHRLDQGWEGGVHLQTPVLWSDRGRISLRRRSGDVHRGVATAGVVNCAFSHRCCVARHGWASLVKQRSAAGERGAFREVLAAGNN